MAELHWFPFYAQDFLTSEGVLCMTPEQIGAYVTLLCVAWGDGTRPPSLPDDDVALGKLSRLGKRWARGRELIRGQFRQDEEGRLVNVRLSEVWQEQQDKHDKAVRRASAGGKAKAEHKQSTSTVQVYHREGEGEREEASSSSSGIAESVRAQLPTSLDRQHFDALVQSSASPESVAAECQAALQGMHGLPVAPSHLAQAVTDYRANNAGKPFNMRHFRGYLRSAAQPVRPPPERSPGSGSAHGPVGTGGRAYLTTLKAIEDL